MNGQFQCAPNHPRAQHRPYAQVQRIRVPSTYGPRNHRPRRSHNPDACYRTPFNNIFTAHHELRHGRGPVWRNSYDVHRPRSFNHFYRSPATNSRHQPAHRMPYAGNMERRRSCHSSSFAAWKARGVRVLSPYPPEHGHVAQSTKRKREESTDDNGDALGNPHNTVSSDTAGDVKKTTLDNKACLSDAEKVKNSEIKVFQNEQDEDLLQSREKKIKCSLSNDGSLTKVLLTTAHINTKDDDGTYNFNFDEFNPKDAKELTESVDANSDGVNRTKNELSSGKNMVANVDKCDDMDVIKENLIAAQSIFCSRLAESTASDTVPRMNTMGDSSGKCLQVNSLRENIAKQDVCCSSLATDTARESAAPDTDIKTDNMGDSSGTCLQVNSLEENITNQSVCCLNSAEYTTKKDTALNTDAIAGTVCCPQANNLTGNIPNQDDASSNLLDDCSHKNENIDDGFVEENNEYGTNKEDVIKDTNSDTSDDYNNCEVLLLSPGRCSIRSELSEEFGFLPSSYRDEMCNTDNEDDPDVVFKDEATENECNSDEECDSREQLEIKGNLEINGFHEVRECTDVCILKSLKSQTFSSKNCFQDVVNCLDKEKNFHLQFDEPETKINQEAPLSPEFEIMDRDMFALLKARVQNHSFDLPCDTVKHSIRDNELLSCDPLRNSISVLSRDTNCANDELLSHDTSKNEIPVDKMLSHDLLQSPKHADELPCDTTKCMNDLLPRDSLKCSTKNALLPRDTNDDLLARDTNDGLLPRGTDDEPLSRDTNIDLLQRDTNGELLGDMNDKVSPRDTNDGLLPRDTNDDELLPRDTNDELLSRDLNDQLLPRDSNDDALLPRDMNDELVPRDTNDELLPRDTNIELLPRNMNDEILLHDTNDAPLPRDTNDELLPRDRNDTPLPRDRNDALLQRDINDAPLPRDTNDELLPRDRNDTPLPRDRNDASLQRDINDVPLPRDTTYAPLLRDTNDKLLLRDSNDEPLPRDTNDKLLPRDTNHEFLSRDANDELLPRHTNDELLPRDANNTPLPRDTNNELVPGDTNNPQLPGDTNNVQLPGHTNDPQLPGDTNNAQLPGDMNDAQLPGDTNDAQLPGDTNNPQLPGDTNDVQFPGDTNDAQLPGDTNNPQLPGDTNDVQLPGDTNDAQLPGDTNNPQLPGDTNDAQLPGDTNDAQLPGDTNNAQLPGDTNAVQFPGDTNDAQLPGDTNDPQLPGDTNDAQLPGDMNNPQLPGDTNNAQLPGDTNDAQLPGDTNDTQLPGDTNDAQLPGDTNDAQSPGDTNDAQLPGDTNDAQLPGDTNDAQLPGDTNDTQLPGDTNDAQLPGDTNDTQLPGDTNNAQLPGDTNDAQLPRDTDDAQFPHDMNDEELLPCDTNDELLPRDVNDELLPRDVNDELLPRDVNDELLPRDVNDELLPRDVNDELLPRDVNDELLPHDTNDELLPRDTNNELLPRDTNVELLPRDTNDELLPRDTNDELLPRDTNDELLPRDTNDELLPHDTNDDGLLPRDSNDDELLPCDTNDELLSRDTNDDELFPRDTNDELLPRDTDDDELLARDTNDELLPRDTDDDELFPRDTNDELLPCDTDDDELFPRDTNDELLSRDTNDELLSRDTADALLPPGTNDESLPRDTDDDELLPHDMNDELLSRDTADALLPPDTNDEPSPRDTNDDESLPRDTDDDELLPHDTNDELLSRDTLDALLPPDTNDEPLPRDTNHDELLPRDTNDDEPLPRDTNDKLLPRDTNDDKLLPRDTNDDELLPRDANDDELLPRDTNDDELLPRDTNDDELLPRDTNDGELLPRDTNDGELLPRDTNNELLPCDTNDEFLQSDTSDELLSRDMNDELLPRDTKNKLLADDELLSRDTDKLLSRDTDELLSRDTDEVVSCGTEDNSMAEDKLSSNTDELLSRVTEDNSKPDDKLLSRDTNEFLSRDTDELLSRDTDDNSMTEDTLSCIADELLSRDTNDNSIPSELLLRDIEDNFTRNSFKSSTPDDELSPLSGAGLTRDIQTMCLDAFRTLKFIEENANKEQSLASNISVCKDQSDIDSSLLMSPSSERSTSTASSDAIDEKYLESLLEKAELIPDHDTDMTSDLLDTIDGDCTNDDHYNNNHDETTRTCGSFDRNGAKNKHGDLLVDYQPRRTRRERKKKVNTGSLREGTSSDVDGNESGIGVTRKDSRFSEDQLQRSSRKRKKNWRYTCNAEGSSDEVVQKVACGIRQHQMNGGKTKVGDILPDHQPPRKGRGKKTKQIDVDCLMGTVEGTSNCGRASDQNVCVTGPHEPDDVKNQQDDMLIDNYHNTRNGRTKSLMDVTESTSNSDVKSDCTTERCQAEGVRTTDTYVISICDRVKRNPKRACETKSPRYNTTRKRLRRKESHENTSAKTNEGNDNNVRKTSKESNLVARSRYLLRESKDQNINEDEMQENLKQSSGLGSTKKQEAKKDIDEVKKRVVDCGSPKVDREGGLGAGSTEHCDHLEREKDIIQIINEALICITDTHTELGLKTSSKKLEPQAASFATPNIDSGVRSKDDDVGGGEEQFGISISDIKLKKDDVLSGLLLKHANNQDGYCSCETSPNEENSNSDDVDDGDQDADCDHDIVDNDEDQHIVDDDIDCDQDVVDGDDDGESDGDIDHDEHIDDGKDINNGDETHGGDEIDDGEGIINVDEDDFHLHLCIEDEDSRSSTTSSQNKDAHGYSSSSTTCRSECSDSSNKDSENTLTVTLVHKLDPGTGQETWIPTNQSTKESAAPNKQTVKENITVQQKQEKVPHCPALTRSKNKRRITVPEQENNFMNPKSLFQLAARPFEKYVRSQEEVQWLSGNAKKGKLSIDMKDHYRRSVSSPEKGNDLHLGNLDVMYDIAKRTFGEDHVKRCRATPRGLYVAAKQGNACQVLVLAAGCNVNSTIPQENHKTAMHAAAGEGHVETLRILNMVAGNLSALDSKLRTPLFDAVENHQVAAVKFLVSQKVNLESKDLNGMTVLHIASKKSFVDIIDLLMETRQLDIDEQDKGGWTALMWSAETRHIEAAKCLLKWGASVHKLDKESNTCLHWAAISGASDILELFILSNAPIDAVNQFGATALHISARERKLHNIRVLQKYHPNVDVKDAEKRTPIQLVPPKSKCHLYLEEMQTSHNLRKISMVERLVTSDVSRGQEARPISCVNEVDDEDLPMDFIYIHRSCEAPTMSFTRTAIVGCNCSNGCTNEKKCDCAQLSARKRFWYNEDGLICSSIFRAKDRPLVYECNLKCKCWATCTQRVVQHGIQAALQVYKTKEKGWAVRTQAAIPKGAFVCEYVGEILTDGDANKRDDDCYLFDLDVEGQTELLCLDAKYYGNVSRFINHSCDPNIWPVRVFTDHQVKSCPIIAFFASRHIEPYEEICSDYGQRFWKVKQSEFNCVCNTPKCKYKSSSLSTRKTR